VISLALNSFLQVVRGHACHLFQTQILEDHLQHHSTFQIFCNFKAPKILEVNFASKSNKKNSKLFSHAMQLKTMSFGIYSMPKKKDLE